MSENPNLRQKEEVVLYKMEVPYANSCVKTCREKLCSWGSTRSLSDMDHHIKGK